MIRPVRPWATGHSSASLQKSCTPIIFAGLYVAAGVAVHWLRLPKVSEDAVAHGVPLEYVNEAPENRHN